MKDEPPIPCIAPQTEPTSTTASAKAVASSELLDEPHLTLTMEEIRDLAQFCGMVVQEPTPSEKDEERETEIKIAKWPKKGVWDEEQECQVPPHRHIAYFGEYPEEGVLPLGSPNDQAHPQPGAESVGGTETL